MSIEEAKELVADLNREYSTSIDNFDLKLNGTLLRVTTEDAYGIKNTSIRNIEGQSKENVSAWIKDIIDSIKVVQRLNKILDDNRGEFNIQYRFLLSKATIKYSIIKSWSYNSVEVALSLDSIKLLRKNIETIEENTDKIIKYSGLGEFIELYFKDDFIGNLIELDFEYDNVYSNLEAHQMSKDALIEKISALEDKKGIVHLTSTLASKALGLLCKFDWLIDFNNVELEIKFDENKVYSTRDKKFIHDSDILNGLLKLYRPNISDIFKNMEDNK